MIECVPFVCPLHKTVHDEPRNPRAEEPLAGHRGPDGFEYLLPARVLQKVTARPGTQDVERIFLVLVDGQDDDFRLRMVLFDDLCRPYPVQFRHRDIHEDNVRLAFLDEPHGVLPVGSFPGDREFRGSPQEHPQAAPDDVMVIGDEYPDFLHVRPLLAVVV